MLVAEDNAANRDLVVYLLRSCGHEAMEACDGCEGLEMARRERPDLVLMDVHMPRMDGFTAVQQLKHDPLLRAIPVVAITALAMVGDRERVLAAGFDGYLPKPITPENFLAQVEEFLSPRAPRPGGSLTGRASILAVDNSRVNLELLRNILEPFGYRVTCMESVRQGLEAARQSLPDLIISDLHMPHETGYDFLRAVKADARLRGVPFVFLSSSILLQREMNAAQGMGAMRFLSRPIEPEVLLREIRFCLDVNPRTGE